MRVVGDAAADQLASQREVERGAHDHVHLEDRFRCEPVALLATGGGRRAVEGIEVIEPQSPQRDVADRRDDAAVDEPCIPVRSRCSDLAPLARHPLLSEELTDGQRPAGLRWRDGVSFLVEAAHHGFGVGSVVARRVPLSAFLLQRAAGHLVKVILRADDSNGMIGDLARQVLDLHRQACAAGVADPQALAKWMVRFAFDDQDFFEVDPVAYANALGTKGLTVYRREVTKRSEPVDELQDRSPVLRDMYHGFPTFAAKYAAERLAVIDGNVDRLVELLGGDLSSPHQFTRVAEAMLELGQPDDALAWARRGIAETNGWQVAKLYDLATDLLAGKGDLGGVVDLRRAQHERSSSASSYAALQDAARANSSWDTEAAAARARLAENDPGGYVDALLSDGEPDRAWAAATAVDRDLGGSRWLRLAEAREPTAPADAMAVYLQLVDDVLERADKRAYRDAVRHLKAARHAATSVDRLDAIDEHLAGTRERNRRRPSLMAMLDKAGLQ